MVQQMATKMIKELEKYSYKIKLNT